MRPRPPSPAGLLAAAAIVATLLSGCGSSSNSNGVAAKTPAQIVAGAKILADAAKSVAVSGTIRTATSPVTVSLILVAGKGGRGRISENGISFQLIQIHGTVYIKGSSAFYSQIAGARAAQLLQGRWLKAPASSGALAPLASLTDLSKLADSTLPAHGPLRKGRITSLNGKKVIGVTDTSTGGTLYVATTGPPYPVQVAMGAGGHVTFSRWNQPVSLFAPANAIDITALKSGH
jgi:hypothetical protein